MILKALYLKIGDLGLPVDYTYGFLKRSRFICNFIEREVLGKIRFHTRNFDRIVISLCTTPTDKVFVNTAAAACVEIPFDRRTYGSKSGKDLSVYYIDELEEGLEKCAQFLKIPKAEIFQGLEVFKANGMKNEWVHKKRVFRNLSLEVSLNCEMTQDAFRLRLEVFHSKKLVFNSVILETDPDENAFGYRFKDIKIEGDYLVVTSKSTNPLWRERLPKLLKQ